MARFQQGSRVENIQVLRLKENPLRHYNSTTKEEIQDTIIHSEILKPSSVVHLIRPPKDGERENARREPRVQNIFIYDGDRMVLKPFENSYLKCKSHRQTDTDSQRRCARIGGLLVSAMQSSTEINPTLSEGDLVWRHVEALRCFLSGFLRCSATHPVMTIHVLQWRKGIKPRKEMSNNGQKLPCNLRAASLGQQRPRLTSPGFTEASLTVMK